MIGVDTIVLLRLFLRDDESQRGRAERCIEHATRESAIMINPIVLAEFAWTLSRVRRLKRDDVADYIERLLSADDLSVLFPAAARRALLAYRSGKADFADYLLASINSEVGCRTTVTFDENALDFGAFSPVP
jgi:predicted nucleic-acid-binding protein